MDNGAPSPGQGRGSRAGTKSRPSEPTEAEANEVDPATEGDGGAAADGGVPAGGGGPNGKRGRGNGRGNGRSKRPASSMGVIGEPLAGAAGTADEEPDTATTTPSNGNGTGRRTPAAATRPEVVTEAAAPEETAGAGEAAATEEAAGAGEVAATEERAPAAPPDDGGPPFTKGRALGRFRSPKSAKREAAAVTAAAVAATVSPPVGEPLTAVPLAGPPAATSLSTPVVTRVFGAPPVAPVIPVVAPVDPSGELVARKVTAPPTVVPLDVPVDPEPTITVPLGRRPGRPSVTFQRRRTRPRVRRVTRVVRHIDTWSVFKVAVVFNAFLYAVTLTAGVLLWHVAIATGTIDNVERFFEGFGWESFQFKGGEIFHNAWIAGLFVAVGLTGLAVLLATLFNLITDLVGGVRVSVLEEEVLARRDRTARMVVEDDPDAEAPYDQARSG